MILNKIYHSTAKWDKDANRWDVADRLKYQWCTNKKESVSPEYQDIADALKWIIEYDIKNQVSKT